MAFELDDLTDVKATPDDNAPVLVSQGGILFGTGKRAVDASGKDWINVYIPPGFIDGWVKKEEGTEVADPTPAPLDPEMFVRQCMLVDRSLNSDGAVKPYLVTADFLIARALLETKITQTTFPQPCVTGPLRLMQNEWDTYLSSDLATAKLFKASDLVFPMVQVYAAGHAMHVAGKGFAEAWMADHAGNDAFVPSYLDLFHTYLTDAATAVAIRTNEADGNKQISTVIRPGVLTAIKSRNSLNQVKDTMSIKDFVAVTEALLASLLDEAFDKIKTFAADELPAMTSGGDGSAPWFDIAKAELDAGVTEASNPSRIRDYFISIGFGPVGPSLPAWCGAFAGFCMKTSGNAVPDGSARAENWKSWGTRSLPVGSHDIPVGTVVVLTPSPGTDTSGHVGFFSTFATDGKQVQLLGGNQSDAVKFSNFPITRIAAIRTLDNVPSGHAASAHFNLAAAGVKKEFEKWGDLIVDRFQRAGFTKDQHLRTALANAIAESGLDPTIKAAGSEESYGLFQCNRVGGLGIGWTVDQLKDPDTNIAIILQAARGVKSFGSASSLGAAMAAFVRYIERPRDPDVAITNRLQIAGLL